MLVCKSKQLFFRFSHEFHHLKGVCEIKTLEKDEYWILKQC